jgi:hypothetical protein
MSQSLYQGNARLRQKIIRLCTGLLDLRESKRQKEDLVQNGRVDPARASLYAAAESRMVALYACEAVRDKDNDIEDFVFTYLNQNVVKMVLLPRQVRACLPFGLGLP